MISELLSVEKYQKMIDIHTVLKDITFTVALHWWFHIIAFILLYYMHRQIKGFRKELKMKVDENEQSSNSMLQKIREKLHSLEIGLSKTWVNVKHLKKQQLESPKK